MPRAENFGCVVLPKIRFTVTRLRLEKLRLSRGQDLIIILARVSRIWKLISPSSNSIIKIRLHEKPEL